MDAPPNRSLRWLLSFCGILGALLIWEAIVGAGFVKSVFLPPPTAVFGAFLKNIGFLITSAAVTLRDIAIGYIIGSVVGVVLGILIGHYRSLNVAVAPILLIISPIPIVTFLPLFI